MDTIVPSKLRNDRFFRRDNYQYSITKDISVYLDHNSLQAACEELQVSVWQFWQLNGF
jgi:hypothetical protein